MKIFIPKISWIGNYNQYIQNAFKVNSAEVVTNSNELKSNRLIHLFKLQQITKIRTYEMHYYIKKYNEKVLQECIASKPDIFIIFNECQLIPNTIKAIKEHCRCIMVSIIGDDPWDSIRWNTDFPHSLKYYDIIFNAEPVWNINIKNVAPKAKIYWHYGGFDPEVYFPVDKMVINSAEIENLSCDVSFTGSSYGHKAEGAYRSDILSYLTDFNLKIWGDDDWPYRFKYLPQLKNSYRGTRLSHEKLRKLYTLSKINLNLPAPQIVTSFQPRVFEIAAVKGFQIADNRPLLKKIFSEEELITFDTIDELREKINYYLNHEKERKKIVEKLYKKVAENYTWKKWAEKIINTIDVPNQYPKLP
jgi:spore maturation protein CgeB